MEQIDYLCQEMGILFCPGKREQVTGNRGDGRQVDRKHGAPGCMQLENPPAGEVGVGAKGKWEEAVWQQKEPLCKRTDIKQKRAHERQQGRADFQEQTARAGFNS